MQLEDIKFTEKAFGDSPMAFLRPEVREILADAFAIGKLDGASRRIREKWQQTQLRNLVAFARERSPLWKQRLLMAGSDNINLRNIPILRRSDVRTQAETEGPLFREADRIVVAVEHTSGSSGVPLRFFRSVLNDNYESALTLHQALQTDMRFALNKTQLRTTSRTLPNGFAVERENSWLGRLAGYARSGISKTIIYNRPDMALLKKELLKDEVGLLVANPWFVETLLQNADASFLKKAGVDRWIPIGGAPDDSLREAFSKAGVPVRAYYSSREVGHMGTECAKRPGFYHVNSTNVIVEVETSEAMRLGKDSVGPVLVTHLHSYATPFIRYENGDVATYHRSCPCGHDGPTLSNLYGRQKNLVKKADGSVATFFIQLKDNRWLTKFDEYRFRQTAFDLIEIDVAGKEPLTDEDVEKFRQMVRSLAGPEFGVKVTAHDKIDWGADTKRLGYRSEIV